MFESMLRRHSILLRDPLAAHYNSFRILHYLASLVQFKKCNLRDFLGGPVVKNLPCNAGDAGLRSLVGELRSHMLRGN